MLKSKWQQKIFREQEIVRGSGRRKKAQEGSGQKPRAERAQGASSCRNMEISFIICANVYIYPATKKNQKNKKEENGSLLGFLFRFSTENFPHTHTYRESPTLGAIWWPKWHIKVSPI